MIKERWNRFFEAQPTESECFGQEMDTGTPKVDAVDATDHREPGMIRAMRLSMTIEFAAT